MRRIGAKNLAQKKWAERGCWLLKFCASVAFAGTRSALQDHSRAKKSFVGFIAKSKGKINVKTW